MIGGDGVDEDIVGIGGGFIDWAIVDEFEEFDEFVAGKEGVGMVGDDVDVEVDVTDKEVAEIGFLTDMMTGLTVVGDGSVDGLGEVVEAGELETAVACCAGAKTSDMSFVRWGFSAFSSRGRPCETWERKMKIPNVKISKSMIGVAFHGKVQRAWIFITRFHSE